jgi:YfiH family protein
MRILEYDIGTGARAFSTMRGEGSGNYGGFNITHYCGDTPEHVTECRHELCGLLGIDDKHLILPRQTHGSAVLCIDSCFVQLPLQEQQEKLYGIDAVITALPCTCIGVSTADCIPLLLHDTRLGVAAAIHAGWRGTVSRIAENCLCTMTARYGCAPQDMKAVIAPGISLDAFEVGDEVYRAFEDAGFDMPLIARRYPTAGGATKWHIDLWEANRMQLMECGIMEENIEVARICTYTRHEEFFSARRLGIESGRIFNGVVLDARGQGSDGL